MAKHKLVARIGSGEDAITLELRGREAWCLTTLVEVGDRGFTTIERPAPRTADYIFRLRGKGVTISTEMEPHAGLYSGRHARYRLGSKVTILREVRE